MLKESIIYFEKPGNHTEELANIVREKVIAKGIKHLVMSSNSGESALKFYEILKDTGVNIVSVTEHAGFSGEDKIKINEEKKKELEKRGIKLLMCSHILSGIGRSISKKFGGISHVEIIAHILRCISEGTKVAVEVAVMAADAGLIPTDTDVIASGGTGRGVDTAIIVKAAHMNNFFNLNIKEIIAKPL
jgi:hypothetical protein